MRKTLREAVSQNMPAEHAPAVQDLPRHQFLQKVSLAEPRFSRLKVD